MNRLTAHLPPVIALADRLTAFADDFTPLGGEFQQRQLDELIFALSAVPKP